MGGALQQQGELDSCVMASCAAERPRGPDGDSSFHLTQHVDAAGWFFQLSVWIQGRRGF